MERKKFWRGLIITALAGVAGAGQVSASSANPELPSPIIQPVQRADNQPPFIPTPGARTFQSSDSNIEMTISEPAPPPPLTPTNTPRPTSTPVPTSTSLPESTPTPTPTATAVENPESQCKGAIVPATYYNLDGNTTASGEIMRRNASTAAIPTEDRRWFGEKMGDMVRLTWMETGASEVVRINDTGLMATPRYPNTYVDVAQGVAERMGWVYEGTVNVCYEILREVEE